MTPAAAIRRLSRLPSLDVRAFGELQPRADSYAAIIARPHLISRTRLGLGCRAGIVFHKVLYSALLKAANGRLQQDRDIGRLGANNNPTSTRAFFRNSKSANSFAPLFFLETTS